MLSVKTGKIPFSKPRGLLGSSRADIHMSCNYEQVLCTFFMPSCAKEKSVLTFPADPTFLGCRGHPAGTHYFIWLQKAPASRMESRCRVASSTIWKSSSSYKASKMLNKKGGWFSKPGMASNDKVTKGIFLVVSLRVGKEGQLNVRAGGESVMTQKASPPEMIMALGDLTCPR